MTRKRAIEIVVASVKMGWPDKRWQWVAVSNGGLLFMWEDDTTTPAVPQKVQDEWSLPRTWLEEKGYLKGAKS